MPPPWGASGTELRTTIELAAAVEVKETNSPVESSRTDLRPEDSVPKLVCPKVRFSSASRSVPSYVPSSASYSVYGRSAPRSAAALRAASAPRAASGSAAEAALGARLTASRQAREPRRPDGV